MTTNAGFVPKAPTIPAQVLDTRAPKERFPKGSVDCHVHIFGPQEKYPHGPEPGYIPNESTNAQLDAMLGVLGCDHAVIVQPSYYGTDNRCTVDAIKASGGRYRGVGHIDPDTVTDAELDALHAAGIRGTRQNIKAKDGMANVAVLEKIARRVARLGWHAQLYFYGDTMPRLDEQVANLPIEIVIDHIGYVRASDGVNGKGFQMLLRLAKAGRTWFKISAPYRQSDQAPLFEDVAPLARALYAAAPDKCVWGSDWPHASRNDTGIIRVPNDGELADAFIGYFPDAADRKRILVDNPKKLYGF